MRAASFQSVFVLEKKKIDSCFCHRKKNTFFSNGIQGFRKQSLMSTAQIRKVRNPKFEEIVDWRELLSVS